MTDTNFDKALAFLLEREGGYGDISTGDDQPTNLGITLPTLSAWRDEACTVDDLKSLTQAEAAKIYYAKYWETCDCDRMPAGVAMCVFDAAVNSGVKMAGEWLQMAVGVTPDGIVGPKTLEALGQVNDPTHIVSVMLSLRQSYMQRLPTWPKYRRGWLNRLWDLRMAAI